MKKISGVLNTNLPKVAKQLFSPKSETTGLDFAFRTIYHRAMCAELFEHLMLFDEVAIVMNVDNSPLSMLIDEFGLNDTARLVESGAIKLILRRVILTSKAGNEKTGISESDGIPPVIPGMIVEDNIFGDPARSIKDAFNYVSYSYSKRDRENFLSRVLPFFIIESSNTGEKAVKLLLDTYHSGALSTLGLPYVIHENALKYEQRTQMLHIASEIVDLMLIASNNYGMYNQASMYAIARKGVGELLNAMHISASMNEITTAEQMPNLQALYYTGKISLHSLVEVRQRSDSATFRNWINDKTKEDDTDYIVSQYIDSIVNQSGFFATGKGKFMKSMMSLGIGLGVGSAVAALIPAAPAVVPLTAAGLAFTAGSKLTEHFSNEFLNGILGSITSGWTPRQYVDSIRKRITED